MLVCIVSIIFTLLCHICRLPKPSINIFGRNSLQYMCHMSEMPQNKGLLKSELLEYKHTLQKNVTNCYNFEVGWYSLEQNVWLKF